MLACLTRLYRLYDGEILLYVGISCDVFRRMREHEKDKPWFYRVTKITRSDEFSSREEAERAEREAIIKEKPIYNVAHKQKTYSDIPETKNVKENSDNKYIHNFVNFIVYNEAVVKNIVSVETLLNIVCISQVEKKFKRKFDPDAIRKHGWQKEASILFYNYFNFYSSLGEEFFVEHFSKWCPKLKTTETLMNERIKKIRKAYNRQNFEA